MVCLKMVCPSTGAAYVSPVRPGIRTVDQALDWMYQVWNYRQNLARKRRRKQCITVMGMCCSIKSKSRHQVAVSTQTEDEKTGVVQRGESTGHAHIIDDMAGIDLFSVFPQRFLSAGKDFTITHEEHKSLTIPAVITVSTLLANRTIY